MEDLPADVVEAHDRAMREGRAGYLDPRTGLFVMTAGYLLQRNRCCGSGCRHCPYDPEAQRLAGRPGSGP
jgi:hypothetical protein